MKQRDRSASYSIDIFQCLLSAHCPRRWHGETISEGSEGNNIIRLAQSKRIRVSVCKIPLRSSSCFQAGASNKHHNKQHAKSHAGPDTPRTQRPLASKIQTFRHEASGAEIAYGSPTKVQHSEPVHSHASFLSAATRHQDKNSRG